jgi:hypothetical protein
MDRFDADGRLKDPNLEDEMREVVDDLLAEPSKRPEKARRLTRATRQRSVNDARQH